MRLRPVAIAISALLVVALAAVGAAAAWVFYTPAGLAWTLAQVSSRAGEALAIEDVAGTLAGGARVRSIRFTGEDIEVRVRSVEMALSPLSLLQLKPRITYLRAAEIEVVTKPGERRDKPPDSLALPADFRVVEAHVARLTMDVGDGPKVFEDVRLS